MLVDVFLMVINAVLKTRTREFWLVDMYISESFASC